MNKKHHILLQKGTYKIFLFSTAGLIWNRVRAIHPPIPQKKKREKKTLNKSNVEWMRPVNTNIYIYIHNLTEQCLVKKSFPSEKKNVYFSISMQRLLSLLSQRVYKEWLLKDPSLFAEPAAVSKTPPALDAWKGNLLAQLININKITLTLNPWYNWVLVFKSKKHVFGKNMLLMDIFGTNTRISVYPIWSVHSFVPKESYESIFFSHSTWCLKSKIYHVSLLLLLVVCAKLETSTCSVVSGRFLCPGLINLP